MDSTVLSDVKASLGDILGDAFDDQILSLINGALGALSQVGALKEITDPIDSNTTWADIVEDPPESASDPVSASNMLWEIKHYIYLDVKILFDSPNSTVVGIMRSKQQEILWRVEVAYNG